MKRIKEFLAERLPVGGALRRFLQDPQPENVGWAHTFGSALLFLLLVQFLSGGVLMFFYAPTPDHAWQSLNYLLETFATGGLLRSLHVYGASLIVIAATLHLLRVLFHGAYKRPRELNWVSGMLAYLLILAFAFTGYLLPWDQKGYWGTRVGTEMIERAPGLGPLLVRLLQGGEEIGAYTLSRFFALHVFFLPVLLGGIVLLHLYLLRRHHIAPHPEPSRRTEKNFSFYPYQVFRDSSAALVALLILLAICLLVPAGLEPRADPSDASYDPRPEWYFLAHYELLRLFSGAEILPIFVIPNLIILFLLAVPFLDRSKHRHWSRRKPAVLAVAGLFVLMYSAVAYSLIYHPAGGIAPPEEELPLPEEGDPELLAAGRRVFVQLQCINCHKLQGVGGLQGPDLSQAGWKFNKRHLRQQILDPTANNPDSKMPSFAGKISQEELEAVVEYLSQML